MTKVSHTSSWLGVPYEICFCYRFVLRGWYWISSNLMAYEPSRKDQSFLIICHIIAIDIWKNCISLGRWFGRSCLAALLLASHFSFKLFLFLLICFGRLLTVCLGEPRLDDTTPKHPQGSSWSLEYFLHDIIWCPNNASKESYQKPKEPAVVGSKRKHLAKGSQNYQILDMPKKTINRI